MRAAALNLATVGMAAFFGSVALAANALRHRMRDRHVSRGLRRITTMHPEPGDWRSRQLANPISERVLAPTIRRMGKLSASILPASRFERLSRQLVLAGSPPRWEAQRVLGVKLVGAVALGLAGLLLALPAVRASRMVLPPLLFGVAGFLLPDLVLARRARERQEEIRRALPDSLDLLSITIQAGLGFDAAVARVARQAGGPLSEELHRVVQEMQLGSNRADALRDLAARTSIPELKSFVLAMVQADTFGISVGKVLQVQAREMRSRRLQHAQERAQKVPVKIVFPLVACILPALFIVLLGPAAIRIYQNLLSGP